MKVLQKYNEAGVLTSVRVQMSAHFVQNLRRYLHLAEDAPLNLHGEVRAVASGSGWYTIYSYNAASRGNDLRFALKILKLCEAWIDQNIIAEIRLLVQRNTYMSKDEEAALVKQFRTELRLPEPAKKSEVKVQSVPQKKLASETALVALQKRINSKFHVGSSTIH